MNKKSIKKFIIPAAIIILLLLIFLIIKITGRKAAPPENNISIQQNAQIQSYAVAGQEPAVKSDDKIFGASDAALKIFVYEDYSNIYSAALGDTLDKIRQEDGNKLAVIVRPYIAKNAPLSAAAALAVDCAATEGKWVEMRALLFVQAKNRQLSEDNFLNYAKQIGLDEAKFTACLTNLQKSEKIEELVKAAKDYSIVGAPTMFVGDEMIVGNRPYDDFIDSNGDKIEGLKKVIDRKLN